MAPHRSYLPEDEAERLFCWKRLPTSGVAKGRGEGREVRPWRHIYGGATMGYAVGYKPVQAVLK